MANPISTWLASLTSGGSSATGDNSNWLSSIISSLGGAAGAINPAQLAFANYQLNGAERDRDASTTQNNEAQKYLKDQLDRTTGLADSLTGKVNNVLGDGTWDSVLSGIRSGTIDPTTKGYMDSATALADKREASNDAEKKALQDSIAGIGDKTEALYAGFGPRKTYTDQDVADAGQDIYNKKVGAVDRNVALASSQGFAKSLTGGLADSTQAADTRDGLARRFSDVYSGLDANSRTEGMNRVSGLSKLQGDQRTAAMTELLSSLNPELQARVATYRPDNTAVQVAQANTQATQADLQRQTGVLNAVNSKEQSQLGSLLQALTATNRQIIGDRDSGATAVAGNASRNLQAAMKAFGETRSSAVAALSPAMQSLGSGTAGSQVGNGTLAQLIKTLADIAMSGTGQSLITPAIAALLRQINPNGADGLEGLTQAQWDSIWNDDAVTSGFIEPGAAAIDIPDLGEWGAVDWGSWNFDFDGQAAGDAP